MNEERVSLVTIANGAALELFERELTAVLTNIKDINTAPRVKREITIKVSFKPDENRERSDIELDVRSKLAGVRPVNKEVFLGTQDGELIAIQSNPKQSKLFDPKPTETDMKNVEQKVRAANDR